MVIRPFLWHAIPPFTKATPLKAIPLIELKASRCRKSPTEDQGEFVMSLSFS